MSIRTIITTSTAARRVTAIATNNVSAAHGHLFRYHINTSRLTATAGGDPDTVDAVTTVVEPGAMLQHILFDALGDNRNQPNTIGHFVELPGAIDDETDHSHTFAMLRAIVAESVRWNIWTCIVGDSAQYPHAFPFHCRANSMDDLDVAIASLNDRLQHNEHPSFLTMSSTN